MNFSEKNIFRKDSITVDFFYQATKERFDIDLINTDVSLDRPIVEQNLHRPGLALAGFVDLFSYKRVQICGNTEVQYLKKLSNEKRKSSVEKLLSFNIPCVIFTNYNKPTDDVLELANKYKIPIFISSLSTTKLSYLVSDFLDDHFAPRLSVHGSFVDVYGIGMLITGKSGIGKSEVALDLVERGHRLVADDVVIFTKKGEGIILGSGTELVKHFMEIRGIGILDVRSMFGIRAIRFQKRLEVVIELEVWNDKIEYTRTGLDTKSASIMDVDIQYVKVPIVPGKNITVICEVIALNYVLKHYGYDAAEVLNQRLNKKLKSKAKDNNRSVDYFEHDFE
ncbi:MAG: HPr kinase/phosphorylase [Ignavibacteriae bacterium]|nr:HPr kinase/phosphorylase [Ignavibacteriota bacterium]MCB9209844.1 HPr kinase/phosphorylase [Ignavibacteriales bacterium]MCB9219001.1 HPr kinase/phosphorylase [Ignavibacteriales bacterium]